MSANGFFRTSPKLTAPIRPIGLDKAGIKYAAAEENLALAPELDITHIGLINYPRHRNILAVEFDKVENGFIGR